MTLARRAIRRLPEAIRSLDLLAAIVMFLVAIPLHYPEQLVPFLHIEEPGSQLGLQAHAPESLFLLLPITYLGFLFGMKAGLASSALALVIMLPRALILAEYHADALAEVGGVMAAGAVINVGFERLRRERERRRAVGEQLRLSEQLYRELFENAHDAIWVHDMAGKITMANKACAQVIGYAPEELIGMRARDFLSEEALSKAREVRRRVLAGKTIDEPYEQQVIRKDGTMARLWLTPSLIISDDQPVAFQVIGRDITEQTRMRENLAFYLQQVTRAQENERQRIAQELHDETAQSLLLIGQRLDGLTSGPDKQLPKTVMRELQALQRRVGRALTDLRHLSRGLRPGILDDLGLVPALEWLADDLHDQYGIQAHVEVDGTLPQLPDEAQLLLFRIAQEALRNVGRHSHASGALVSLDSYEGWVKMSVIDNGCGFQLPPNLSDLATSSRLGLLGMYERARLLGGTLDIRSEPDKGTAVIVKLAASAVDWLPTR